jgi:hypothetical protein
MLRILEKPGANVSEKVDSERKKVVNMLRNIEARPPTIIH